MKLIYVKWSDALGSQSHWMSQKETKEWAAGTDWINEEIGQLLEENKAYIVIANEWSNRNDSENMYNNITKIPTSWILEKKNIKIGDRR